MRTSVKNLLKSVTGSGLGGISGVGTDSKGFKGFFLHGTK